MAEHRVPMPRRRVDPAESRDPQVRRLVGALATLEIAPPPRAEFRAELRAQLVAVTPRLVAEGEARVPAPKRRRRMRLARPVAVAVGVLAVFIVLLGGAVLLSQNALPGDTLYGIKRASEDTRYGLTGSAVAKGELKLDFAARRIDEVSDLVPKAGGAISANTDKLVRQTLASADGDVRSASRMLGTAAVQDTSAAPLDAVTGWAPGEITQLSGVAARIPAGTLHTRVVATQNLIKAAEQRAVLLKADLGCGCLASSGSDALGPIPCTTGCASVMPRAPGSTSTTTPSIRPGQSPAPSTPAPAPPAAGTTRPGHAGGATSSAPPGSRAAVPRASSTPAARSTGPAAPGLPLPTSTAPGLPINVSSCGIQASLAGIGIGIGGC